MKQFLTALAANFVTVAVLVVAFFLVLVGIAASFGGDGLPRVAQGSALVIDLGEPLVDAPAERSRRSLFDDALSGDDAGTSIRAALLAIRAAAHDTRISGIVIRGSVGETGYATLRELRNAIADFRRTSSKPVYAFLVNPDTRDYYVASAASNVTLDPFGAVMMPGLSADLVFLAGLLEKYGVGVQVTRVGRFKAAVEPLTRSGMSPENRLQTERYLGSLWSEVKRAIAESRNIDTLAVQQVVDARGIIEPVDARTANLVDRVDYWDAVLRDIRTMVEGNGGTVGDSAPARGRRERRDDRRDEGRDIPQVTLSDYALVATAKATTFGADQTIAIVYASGDIVDGEGGPGLIGADALARDLRDIRDDDKVKAVVLRVNSPGGSAIASETMQRELELISRTRPVVVSMGSVAASGGYWIATAATRMFAEPNTITGSIGVFGLLPNVKKLANDHGVTFDTVNTGRFADIFSIARPRTPAEMAVIQRSTDAIYEAFIARVAAARALAPDSVRMLAEGRVWSGEDALRIGLVDSIGGLDAAVTSAAALAKLTGEYGLDEYPRRKGAAEILSQMLERTPPPVAKLFGLVARAEPRTAARGAAARALAGRDPAQRLARDLIGELEALLRFDDPRGAYARMPFALRVR